MVEITTPRLRYFIVTPTIERGSPLKSFSCSSGMNGYTFIYTPARWLSEPERECCREGLIMFQRDILQRRPPIVETNEESVTYTINFSREELLLGSLSDFTFFEQRAHSLHDLSHTALPLLQEIKKLTVNTNVTDALAILDKWKYNTSSLFKNAIPFLLVDELFIKEAVRIIGERSGSLDQAWCAVTATLTSPYIDDVILGHSDPLPASRDWQQGFRSVFVPANVHPLHSTSSEKLVNLTRPVERFSPYELHILRRAPYFYRISEQIHYVLGALILAGNWLYYCISSVDRGYPTTGVWPTAESRKDSRS